MADTVARGAVWSDLTEAILDIDGVPITTAVQGDFTIVLLDSADVDRSSGITVTHSTGGRYRLEKTIASDAATGSWGGTVTYDDGSLLSWEQEIDFAVTSASGATPLPSVLAADQTLTLTIGHSYLPGDGDAIQFTDDALGIDWSSYDLTDDEVEVFFVALRSGLVVRQDMDVIDATTVQLELTARQTYTMRNVGSYRIYALLPGQTDPVTLVSGTLSMQGT